LQYIIFSVLLLDEAFWQKINFISIDSNTTMKPNIFTYLDYRHYMVDLFTILKKDNSKFSYREFGRIAGSTSPNFLQYIRDRKLNISSAAVIALSQTLHFNKKEESYFETIVAFDHAKTHDEKDKHFQRILLTREYGHIKQLEKKQYDYLAHWYIPVIRELVVRDDYPFDPAWIAERIIPRISESKVRKGIKILESLGLIRMAQDGKRWIHTDRVISTPSEILSIAVVKHTKKIFILGTEAIERFPASERDLRGVTLGISNEYYVKLKQRMEAFWKEIMALAEKQDKVDRVYQINLQLFPMSRE
jgi:uncharacterized protein (TIGR02147 family)